MDLDEGLCIDVSIGRPLLSHLVLVPLLSVGAGSVVVVVGVEVGVLERVLGLCLALHHSPHGCLLPTAEFSFD